MNVGNWMDTMGIQNPAKTKNSGRGAPAQPAKTAQAAQPPQADKAKQPATAGTPGKRVRKAPNPEAHLAQLRVLLESHGEPVTTMMSWAQSNSTATPLSPSLM